MIDPLIVKNEIDSLESLAVGIENDIRKLIRGDPLLLILLNSKVKSLHF